MSHATIEKLLDEIAPRLAAAFSAAYGVDRGEEALGEAVAYAWEHRAELVEMANPAGYLYRVGQSRTRPRRSPRFLPPPAEIGVPEVEPDLVPALEALTERQRTCVALVVGHRWSHQEVANLLDISKSSVQHHVMRAMAHLRERLGANSA